MSIIVNNAKMPKTCFECLFYKNENCFFDCNLTDINVKKTRSTDCPLIPLRPAANYGYLCKGCPNAPKNNGSGICHCFMGQRVIPY